MIVSIMVIIADQSLKLVQAQVFNYFLFKKTSTKFANALKQYGVNEFEWFVFETIKYANRDDLYRLEHEYVRKYDSSNNGYNTRFDFKQQQE